MMPMRYLSTTDLLQLGLMDWPTALRDVAATIRLLHSGDAGMVPESVMSLGLDPRSKAYGLPAFVGGGYDAAGLKWTLHRPAAAADRPAITSTTLLNALSDGRPLGMAESALITRVRTAAVSATAIRALLSHPPRRIAILGAGGQAETHLDMVLALFPALEAIDLWNRTPARLDALIARRAAVPGPERIAHDQLSEAIAQADVILCCTSAPDPFVTAEAVRPGRLIVQVGFHEVTFEAIAASDAVCVDLWGDFADKSAKSLFQMYRAGAFCEAQVKADLPRLLIEGWHPPPGAALYFSSFGLNVFDIAFAARLMRQAEAQGIGTLLPSA
ncbi:hypothetical protein [Rhodobacter lacus]|uniref:Ornithine cyclodeaminase n=1 Tax=Rhodobacter lacus TaxID=1641972 RepID=A0ABW5A921_9RHOB